MLLVHVHVYEVCFTFCRMQEEYQKYQPHEQEAAALLEEVCLYVETMKLCYPLSIFFMAYNAD